MAETRVVNGVTYTRVPGGWQKAGPPRDPTFDYKGPKAAADLGLTEAQIRAANARTEQMARETALEEKRFNAAQADKLRPQISPEQRKEALKAWSAANELGTVLPEVEKAWKAGPGSTRGVRGVLDFLPSDANQNFDRTAGRLRAPLKGVLGFTGTEGDAAKEASAIYDPYIAKSSTFDGTARGTFRAVEGKRNTARQRAAMQLGGIPDSNGRVTPIPKGYRMGEFPDLDEAIATRIDRIPLNGRQEFIKDARRRYLAIRQRSTRDEDALIEKYLR